LVIRLADQTGTNPVSTIQGTHNIHLSFLTDPTVTSFEDEELALSQVHPIGRSALLLKALPADGEIVLQAEDKEKDLVPGSETITLESRIQAVKITGTLEARCYSGGYRLDVHLTDKDGQPQTADWDRKLTLSVARGSLTPAEVTLRKNESRVTVTYHPPWSVGNGTDSVTAESLGLRPAELALTVVMSAYVLVSFAGLGGLLGGLARESYKGHFRQIIPKWRQGRLQVGVLGHMLFGSLFGVILFQAANLGLVTAASIPKLAAQGRPMAQTLTFAFFFGVLGGFGGIVILARLLEKVLPGDGKSDTAARAPASSP
jgi:hypothetical protein